jgi:DNA modification methylase
MTASSFIVQHHTFARMDAGAGLRSLPAGAVACVITSPPYFRCRNYASAAGVSLAEGEELGQEKTPFEYVRRLAAIFGYESDQEYLAANGSIFVVIGDSFATQRYVDDWYPTIRKGETICVHHLFVNEMRLKGWRLWQEAVWNKPNAPPSGAGKRRLMPTHEYVLWFTTRDCEQPYADMESVRIPSATPAGFVMRKVGGDKYATDRAVDRVSDGTASLRDVITQAVSHDKSKHVAPMPEALCEIFIKIATKQGDLVCDPFAGSRTMKRVAERLGRSSASFDIIDWLQQ